MTSVPSPESDSNRRPLPYHGSALPTELSGRVAFTVAASAPGEREAGPAAGYGRASES